MTKSYVSFHEMGSTTKTKWWTVLGVHGDRLGTVKFFGRWRCYAFWPQAETVFNAGCMDDIARFCNEQTVLWREGLKATAK